MSRNSLLALTAGTAGALLLGYCIYYDRKRRSDPNYKKKVHERRQKTNPLPFVCDYRGESTSDDTFELNDHEVVQHYFQNEIKMAEDLFRQAKLDAGLVHLANAIMVCAQPVALLEAMKVALPDRIFNLLLTKLPDLQLPNPLGETTGVDLALD
ncbi:mitochondrial import receptor subunit TOM20 homolog [Drosophila montana]|uniref:mitochondrial import receptor subunit TOM20 homolog n=1 Tax=Drosophila montana TaxID=40370 RepID=UPI00313E3DAB